MTTFNKKKVVNEFLCPNETQLHKAFWVIKNQESFKISKFKIGLNLLILKH